MIPVPVVLFAYARPDHLRRTLTCLRANRVPLIYAFSDGPKTPEKAPMVAAVRSILHAIDWCEVRVVQRTRNLGLGLSIRTGVAEVFRTHEAVLVLEDDLVCVPGTYEYLCAAMEHYSADPRVMSVTGWTHPRVTPADVTDQPYFDGRAECLLWGAWRRSWEGMEETALEKIDGCEEKGIDPFRYGADLVQMARVERERNIWAVRFLYNHIVAGGLCLRPPHTLVEHIGFDAQATYSQQAGWLANQPLRRCPPLPDKWPQPEEHPDCPRLWQQMCGSHRTTSPAPRPHRPPLRVQVKNALRPWTPPALVNYARRVVRSRQEAQITLPPTGPAEWEYIPEGWLYQSPGEQGWNVESVVKTQLARWPQFLSTVQGVGPLGISHEAPNPTAQDLSQHNIIMSFAYVLALAAHEKGRLSVLDWGSGIGHYYVLARALMPQIELDYHCKDLPLLCEAGSKLLPDAHFCADESCLKRTYDLVLASGSLQYSEDWRGTAASLARASKQYVYIARLPMVRTSPSFVALQRPHRCGYLTEYLTWFLNRDELVRQLSICGMTLMREFLMPSQFVIPNAPAVGELGAFLFRAPDRE